MTTNKPSQSARAGDATGPLTDAEVEQALIAVVSAVERGGCPVGMCHVRDKDPGGMTITMHYSNDRARKCIARPTPERGMAEDEVERLTAILMLRNLPGCRNGPITEPRELAAHILAALRSGQPE